MSTVTEREPVVIPIVDPIGIPIGAAPAPTGTEPEAADRPSGAGRGRSPMTTMLMVMVAAIATVWAGTITMIMALTDVSFGPAIGFGAYCAFWLGGGFGTIFGSAAVFGRDH